MKKLIFQIQSQEIFFCFSLNFSVHTPIAYIIIKRNTNNIGNFLVKFVNNAYWFLELKSSVVLVQLCRGENPGEEL